MTTILPNCPKCNSEYTYEDGLAKLIEMPVNWCEELGTVLSNDEVIDGKSSNLHFPRVGCSRWPYV